MTKIKNVLTWNELVTLENEFDSSGKERVFRGLRAPGHMKTTLERAYEDFKVEGETIEKIASRFAQPL